MKREDIARLLGGYAADNLTPEEQQALFEGALQNQELFDALAREQPLRELLQDPSARRQLLAELERAPEPLWPRVGAWICRPVVLALVGGVAAVVVTVSVWLPHLRQPAAAPEILAVAKRPAPPAPPVAASAPPKPAVPAKPARAPRRVAAARPAPTGVAPAEPPPPPATEATQAEVRKAPARPATGGVAGGAGGLVPAQRPPPPPAEAVQAEGRIAPAAAAPRVVVEKAAAPEAVLARSLYYGSPSAGLTLLSTGAPRNLGLRCRVLRRDEDDAYAEVDPAAALRDTDRLRLVFEPNAAGFLYVLEQRPGGSWRRLFGAPVQPGTAYTVPISGPRRIRALLSRTAETEPALRVEEALAQRGGDLAAGTGQPSDRALYGVSRKPFARSVILDIGLRRAE